MQGRVLAAEGGGEEEGMVNVLMWYAALLRQIDISYVESWPRSFEPAQVQHKDVIRVSVDPEK